MREIKKHPLNRSQTVAHTAWRRVNPKCAMSCRNIKINWLPGLFHFEEPKIICVYPTDMIFTLCVYRWMTGKLTFIRFLSVFSSTFASCCRLFSIQWTENDLLGLRVIESNKIKSEHEQNRSNAKCDCVGKCK